MLTDGAVLPGQIAGGLAGGMAGVCGDGTTVAANELVSIRMRPSLAGSTPEEAMALKMPVPVTVLAINRIAPPLPRLLLPKLPLPEKFPPLAKIEPEDEKPILFGAAIKIAPPPAPPEGPMPLVFDPPPEPPISGMIEGLP